MHKTELVAQIAEKTGQSQKVVGSVVDSLLESIGDAVAGGESVTFVGFGTFATSKRAARTGRHPQTGESIAIEASTLPKFTAGSALKAKVKGS